MVTWTKKAELDFRRRHPHRECTRRAGTKATYDGIEISRYHTVYDGFMMRGWLHDSDYNKLCRAKANEKTKRFLGGRATPQQIEDRWRIMIAFTKRETLPSLRALTEKMGLVDSGTLTIFCQRYGKNLAKRIGKLGKIPTLNQGIWLEIMEQ